MGGDAPTVTPMAPTQISKTIRESESTSWVPPLKCKYLTIGSYHSITPDDFIKCNELNPFLKNRPKSFTLNSKDFTHKIESENLIVSHSNANGHITKVKIESSPEANGNGSIIKRETEASSNGTVCCKEKPDLIKSTTHIQGENGTAKPVRSRATARKPQKGQPIKNLCCCWSVPKNTQLSDSGGPADGQKVPDSNNVVTATDALARNNSTRGSLRKVLPSVPDMDQQLSMSAKMIDRRTSTPKGNHSYGPYFLEYTLLAEYNLLQTQKLGGVYVVPSANSPLVWFGVIFLRQGPYKEGIFRFNLHIPENYPDGDVPSVIFEGKVFHPLIDIDTGELDVKRGFANKWKRNVNHLWHVLSYIRKAFYKIETSNPLNPEAAVLFANDNERFLTRVKDCVTQSKDNVYEPPSTPDPHAIVFSEYQPAIHDTIRDELKKERNTDDISDKEISSKGLSWVKPGTLQIFSKSAS